MYIKLSVEIYIGIYNSYWHINNIFFFIASHTQQEEGTWEPTLRAHKDTSVPHFPPNYGDFAY